MALNATQRAAIRHIISYESSPPDARMGHKDWCEVMGISARTLQSWMSGDRCPEFVAALEKARSEMEDSSDPFALVARQWALEQLMVLYKKGKTTTEKRQLLKEILDKTAHVASDNAPVDYSEMTDDDLVALALNRGVSVLAMSESEIRRLADKGASDGEHDSGKRDDRRVDTATADSGGSDDSDDTRYVLGGSDDVPDNRDGDGDCPVVPGDLDGESVVPADDRCTEAADSV